MTKKQSIYYSIYIIIGLILLGITQLIYTPANSLDNNLVLNIIVVVVVILIDALLLFRMRKIEIIASIKNRIVIPYIFAIIYVGVVFTIPVLFPHIVKNSIYDLIFMVFSTPLVGIGYYFILAYILTALMGGNTTIKGNKIHNNAKTSKSYKRVLKIIVYSIFIALNAFAIVNVFYPLLNIVDELTSFFHL